MLCKFVNNTVRALVRKNHVCNYIMLGVELGKAAVFLLKVIFVVGDIVWIHSQLTHKSKYHNDINLVALNFLDARQQHTLTFLPHFKR